jgi:hypothetical protein
MWRGGRGGFESWRPLVQLIRCNADDQPLGVRLGPGCRSVHVSAVRARDRVNSEFACDTEPFPAQPDGARLSGMLRSVHDAEDIFRRPICAHGVPTPSSKPVVTAHLAVSSRRCAARTKASSNAQTSPPSSPPVSHSSAGHWTGQAGISVTAHLACGDGQPSGTSAAPLLPRRHSVLLVFPRAVRLRRRQRRVLAQPSVSV